VETGIRQLLSESLTSTCTVTKQGLRLPGSTKTLNPDLVFDSGFATGDVKYKVVTSDWDNGDLYQAVAFATGHRTSHALIVAFSERGATPQHLQVGDVTVTRVCWDTRADTPPHAAAALVSDAVRHWFEESRNPVPPALSPLATC
jgi:hypothetical protein